MIKKGQKISSSDIVFKRPGDGISPEKISDVIGKFAKNDIDEDHVIYMDDIE